MDAVFKIDLRIATLENDFKAVVAQADAALYTLADAQADAETVFLAVALASSHS